MSQISTEFQVTDQYPGQLQSNQYSDPLGNALRNPGHRNQNGHKPPRQMNQNQQSAFDLMLTTLKEYDLQSLGGILRRLILDGTTDPAELTLALQSTQEWKVRFAGNEMLKKKGLAVLGVQEYLATERAYAQIMKNAGLPPGFFDDHGDFANWIGNNVSANEIQQRVNAFSDLAKREDPAIIAQLKSMGLSRGDILAYFMDPKKSMPLIQQKYQQTLLGTAARRNGIVADNDYLKHLADLGITEQQAQQGFGTISENMDDLKRLGQLYGEDYTQHDFEQEVFENNGDAANKRKRLASRERATFGGNSGVGRGSLTRQNKGSY